MSYQGGLYDEHRAKDPQDAQAPGSNSRLANTQDELQAAIRQMHENVIQGQKRQEGLDNLNSKSENLATSAQGFRRGANRVRKQMWWKDMKMRICIIVGIIILLLVIILPIAITKSK